MQFEMINTTAAGWTPWGHGSINQLVATNRVRACTRTSPWIGSLWIGDVFRGA